MGRAQDRTRPPEEGLRAALQAGEESTFGALVERHRRELRVHCYRMLGSFEDAEDLVQETFLHAWRSRATFTFQGAMSFRAWLYRIATNLCLDRLERRPRGVLPSELGPAADPRARLQPPADLLWLQPFPDRLLEDVSPSDTTPDEAVVSKETIELTFLATIQFLPPRQRAVLILRDVLDWSAKETASLLGSSVASVNSALQRARATLKTRLPASRLEWSAAADRSAAERQLLRRYIDAYESGDLTELAHVLREDARLVMPPYLEWYDGRASIVAFAQAFSDPTASGFRGELRGYPYRPTDNRRSRGICDRHATRRTKRSRWTCFGSRTEPSLRSQVSSSPTCSRHSGSHRRFEHTPSVCGRDEYRRLHSRQSHRSSIGAIKAEPMPWLCQPGVTP